MQVNSRDSIQNQNSDIKLISKDEPIINARIQIICPQCGYKRRFRNTFTCDNMHLVNISLGIIDWMTCERCGSLFDTKIEFLI